MKVGNHAGETWEQILARKRREFEQTGRTFWGYGGSACHPLNQVQPFSRLCVNEDGGIKLVMIPVNSSADRDSVAAKEYSEDGIVWKPIPKEILVTGSRYALVLGEIQIGELDVPLGEYNVGIGPSQGKIASEYLRGRTDKGCFVKQSPAASAGKLEIVRAGAIAPLKEPFAVLLRH